MAGHASLAVEGRVTCCLSLSSLTLTTCCLSLLSHSLCGLQASTEGLDLLARRADDLLPALHSLASSYPSHTLKVPSLSLHSLSLYTLLSHTLHTLYFLSLRTLHSHSLHTLHSVSLHTLHSFSLHTLQSLSLHTLHSLSPCTPSTLSLCTPSTVSHRLLCAELSCFLIPLPHPQSIGPTSSRYSLTPSYPSHAHSLTSSHPPGPTPCLASSHPARTEFRDFKNCLASSYPPHTLKLLQRSECYHLGPRVDGGRAPS